MALENAKNYKAVRENYELVSNALFDVTLFPPSGIKDSFKDVEEHILGISGAWDDKNSSEVVQQQVGMVRTNHASDDVGDNTINFSIDFSLFLDREKRIYVYNAIRNWRRLVFDAETGLRGTKADYVGGVFVEKLARNDDVVASRLLKNVWPINDMPLFSEFEKTNADAKMLTVEFVADYHEDIFR